MRIQLFAALLLTAACVGSGAPAANGETRAPSAPVLSDLHPCAGQPGFTCSWLTVPLDHRGSAPGELKLQVATADNTAAPQGVLLFLTGGPGQPGVPFVSRIPTRLPELMAGYRLVMIDQRGTGEFGAINCPQLQAQVGSSDIAVPTRAAIDECAGIIGDKRDFYTTEQTVGDLDLLRQALGAGKMTVDGVSYGSFVAARYTAEHPGNVEKLVLDSVLPHIDPQSDDPLYLTALKASARVLRDACSVAPACGYDPAKDLAWVARNRSDAVYVFDALVTYEFFDPTYRRADPALPGGGDIISAFHAARQGDPAKLDAIITALKPGGDPVNLYSSGLHIATICSDGNFPWGDSETTVSRRQTRLDKAEKHLKRDDVWPFTAEVAVSHGFIQECLPWPVARHTEEPPRRLPPVPTLILNGDRDLSTPLEWALEQARYTPNSKVVIVKGAAHSIQNREQGTAGRDAVYAFLDG